MKILYGIQGTGNGHLARARALAPKLLEAGIEIDFVFSGRAKEDFFNMDVFNDCRYFKGLTFVTERGQLKTFKTITQIKLIQFIKDVSALDVSSYDLVISDFEPVTAWAAKLKGKPSISISHQAAFRMAVPKVKGVFAAKLLMKIFAPTRHHLGLHWHHFDQAVLPPIIEKFEPKPPIANKIVVYMGFEAVEDIIKFVKPFPEYRFHIYAKVNQKKDLGHITVEPLSHENFHNDLLDAAGVISNAGFELSSECISLGKKMLIKPVTGQYEQLSNALALQAIQKGTVIRSLDQSILKRWLSLPLEKPAPYPDTAQAIVSWLVQGNLDNNDALINALWQQSRLSHPPPEPYCRHIIHGLLN